MTDLVVRSGRVVLPGGMRPASVQIRAGRIVAIRPHSDWPAGVRRLDAGELVVLPGLIDTHVHINEPGRTDWEGFEHATRAAAAGGITTLIDMPLNSIPPTTSVDALEAKRSAAAGRCHVDVGFWGGIVPGNSDSLDPLARAGVLGFKCFLSPSGVDEFPYMGEADLLEVLPILARLDLPLLVHAEWPGLLQESPASADRRSYLTWLRCRPPASEHAAVDLLIRLARDHQARVHIVHLSSASVLPLVAAARAGGVALSVETCPHYLTFAAEEIPDGATAFKCAPPIRERAHREALWQALAAGDIDLVATDHSPAPPALKQQDTGDFLAAWGGIASLQIGLAAVWTGARMRGLPVEQLARWLAEKPARLAGLHRAKGSIAVGHDADLVIYDPDGAWTVDPAALYHRHPITPYAGVCLRGTVKTTILRGQEVFFDNMLSTDAAGQLIRPDADDMRNRLSGTL